MKTFKVTVEIANILGGTEIRTIFKTAKTMAAAEKAVGKMMGNRDFWIKSIEGDWQERQVFKERNIGPTREVVR